MPSMLSRARSRDMTPSGKPNLNDGNQKLLASKTVQTWMPNPGLLDPDWLKREKHPEALQPTVFDKPRRAWPGLQL